MKHVNPKGVMMQSIPTSAAVLDAPVALQSRTVRFYHDFGVKRALDILGSAILMLLLFPVIAFVYLRVRRDGGPGFYAQQRVGHQGILFKCWKLRSMCVDADTCLHEHLANDKAAATEWAVSQKLTDDPRITKLGRVIRKYSIDELPQLWNVFIGEMSLVGPRPITSDELYRYENRVNAYLELRPGITGLWQVSGRNALSYEQRIDMDVSYWRNVSLLGDIRLLIKTITVVIFPTGM